MRRTVILTCVFQIPILWAIFTVAEAGGYKARTAVGLIWIVLIIASAHWAGHLAGLYDHEHDADWNHENDQPHDHWHE